MINIFNNISNVNKIPSEFGRYSNYTNYREIKGMSHMMAFRENVIEHRLSHMKQQYKGFNLVLC